MIHYENNEYYFVDDAGGGPYGLVGSKLTIKKLTADKIEFEMTTIQSANESEIHNGVSDITNALYDVKPFVLIKEDGKWKVDEFVHTFYE